MMLLRPLAAVTLCISCLFSEWAIAQVVECPGSLSERAGAPLRRDAKVLDLLQRFIGVLDLRDRLAISEARIMQHYAHRDDELMAELQELDNHCLALVQDGRQSTAKRQQIMRRRFLETILTSASEPSTDVERTIKGIELEIQQSIAEQARRRWFREPKAPLADGNRWAVIVASPAAASAWDALKRHQERWPKMHFELHVPYDESSPYYAVVVGRRLPEEEATTLVDRVQRAGLASDSYKFPLPMSTTAKRLPAGDADDRSDAKIAAVERRKASPPANDDTSQKDLVVVPAQFAGDAQAASSFLDRFATWWSELVGSGEVVAADYMRPNCGIPVSHQRAGVPFCARDNDSDRGGSSGSDGGSDPDPDPPAKDPHDDCKPR